MSIRLKINTAILIVCLVIGGLFFIGKTGFDILSGLRAYVGGEGLWGKSQKEATYQLTQYIFTKQERRYQLFLESLKIPLGDKVARMELEKEAPDPEIVFQGFIDGGIHPEDIPTVIFLYKWFRNQRYVKDAIFQWKLGDKRIDELITTGEEARQLIMGNQMTYEKAAVTLAHIDRLQRQLTEIENSFSDNMSAAARRAANLVFAVMIVFTLIGSCLCFIIMRLISGIISDLNRRKKQIETQADEEMNIKKILEESEERFRALADTSPLAIYMSEGVAQKATYINPTFIELFGYTIDDVPTVADWWPLAYPDPDYRKQVSEEWQEKVEKAIESESEIEPMEVVVTCKDGSKKDISWGFITIGKENWACGLNLTARKTAERERENVIAELQKSLVEINTLRGILPICSACKSIRNDDGYYEKLEEYFSKHTGVDFSHTICNPCMEKLYPDVYQRIAAKKKGESKQP